ncbi:hypothetical protein KSD_17360 [Ktedonobacter sp. SOSP1-85]|uniref:hypothetical protein n=1 Tax=Ktedonobacter sp. SOSP1-85 TaxID=2778367 RepID=UPI001916BAE2|nr:hypothetical protein [Ktedonobacter sp. SOSP1-85]GHO73965.1 hypothetical protein KSD_17360 [Ktedonobacter sp. SOSP1-85]
MSLHIPASADEFGFINESVSVHGGRTMMLAELRLLLAACQQGASLNEYQAAIIEENVLLKRTVATRRASFLKLRVLYALDTTIVLFRSLRDLWDEDVEAQPLLALLSAVARDAILRGTAEKILALPIGESIEPEMLAEVVDACFPQRYNSTTLASIGRNAISSWQQAGFLSGKLKKVRVQTHCHPASVTYALLLGHFSGARGEALFQTIWCRLLDTPMHILHEHAIVASQRGWIEYRHMGNVTEVGFRHLLRK